jgi:hypothetical protein
MSALPDYVFYRDGAALNANECATLSEESLAVKDTGLSILSTMKPYLQGSGIAC